MPLKLALHRAGHAALRIFVVVLFQRDLVRGDIAIGHGDAAGDLRRRPRCHLALRAAKAPTLIAAFARRTLSAQSPDRAWRKRRADRYQSQSSSRVPQHQNGSIPSSTHTGLPMAPARCAAAVQDALRLAAGPVAGPLGPAGACV